MKLQKQFACNYKGKNHYKSVIVLPDHIVLKRGWSPGQESESAVKGDRLILGKKKDV